VHESLEAGALGVGCNGRIDVESEGESSPTIFA
jgi:hypothetical protein